MILVCVSEKLSSSGEQQNGSANQETTLRDQILVSIQAGPIKMELQRQVCRNSAMTCSELFQEAKELEKEGWSDDCEGWSRQVTMMPPADDSTEWKDETKAELVRLVIELGTSMKEELRSSRQTQVQTEGALDRFA